MPEQQPIEKAAKGIRLIHLALCVGLFLITAIIVPLKLAGRVHVSEVPPYQSLLITLVGVLSIAIAFAIFRPKVGTRASTESPDAFWSERRRASALIVWAEIEGAGLLGVVGYLISGMWTPLALSPLALAALVLTRPSSFDGGA